MAPGAAFEAPGDENQGSAKNRPGGMSFLGRQRDGGSRNGQAVALNAVAFEKTDSLKTVEGNAAVTFETGHLRIAAAGNFLKKA